MERFILGVFCKSDSNMEFLCSQCHDIIDPYGELLTEDLHPFIKEPCHICHWLLGDPEEDEEEWDEDPYEYYLNRWQTKPTTD